jgi:hypothetical protein
MTSTRILLAAALAACAALHSNDARAQACTPVQECGDVDDSGGITATDSLRVLSRAVGLPLTLTCECQAGGEVIPSRTVRTGQTTCFDVAGVSIPCAGTGQDGEFQAGSPRVFTDNGDGTVTDEATGLVWEKHGDEDGIHDRDGTYSWTDAVAVKIATLNSTAFAGFSDWRLPNRVELETLFNLGAGNPATFPALSTPCDTAGCSSTTCSCTTNSIYWTSTSDFHSPAYAWYLNFSAANVAVQAKTEPARVRAVRSAD